jgi:colanic acid/amylovoran biosynthesis glycosyltransferase
MHEPRPSGTRLAIFAPGRDSYSETFIRAHIDRLPGTVEVLRGDEFPTLGPTGDALFPLRRRAFHRLLAAGFGSDRRDLKTATLARLLRHRRYDVALAEYGPTGAAVANACQRARVPLVIHFHGYDAFTDRVLNGYADAYRNAFATASAVIAVSSEMECQLEALGAPREKLHRIVCGVDAAVFVGSNPAVSSPTFAAVGRFVEKKAPHLTILAFQKVLEHQSGVHLLMVGDGPLLEPCRQLVRAAGLEDHVSFLGVLPHRAIVEVLHQVRAFVQHSVTTSWGDREGTPVAVLEAMSSGLPVVATCHAGIADVVTNGETGFLGAEFDIQGMAASMLRLARDPALAECMGTAARRRILDGYTVEASIGRLANVLASVARPPGGSGVSTQA